MFDAPIIQNTSLSNVSLLYYLKSAVTCEAAKILKNVTIKGGNFQSTWKLLKDCYDYKRELISTHLGTFVNLPKISSKSAEKLKELRDTINQALEALKTLQRPVDQWNDLLVFLIVQKLDDHSLQEWETKLGSKHEYPTYEELDEFLANRIRVLKAIEASNPAKTDKKENAKPPMKFSFVRKLII